MEFRAFHTYASILGMDVAVTPQEQNGDYESGAVRIDGDLWHIRTARVTPTKPGAFLAFWRRDAAGKTAPFDEQDPAAGLLVFVEQDDRRGVFRFAAADLSRLGITAGRTSGKRGFRVYPSWCAGLNPQATATQRAQASAFREY
ncbi:MULTISPECIES: MepB family protein [unclassified Microbacterium]|uniref:MepB family protein n=1 Tax=unclassified Microbacterium TaxID=2609290 RepID=UPI000CFE2CBE|nr:MULTISPECIES: MepB family protein [unclassified Microbacterium]PRB07409.1 metallopeptidase [Microbacterium sp. MYb72]